MNNNNNNIVGLLFAIFLGWCGGYRFYKKQFLLGIIYLFTFGLFGIGWIVDIILSAVDCISDNSVSNVTQNYVDQNSTVSSNDVPATSLNTKAVGVPYPKQQLKKKQESYSYHKQFNVTGVTFDCGLAPGYRRQEILAHCRLSDKLYLKEYSYKGTTAYYIVLEKNNTDIGSVPADLVSTIKHYIVRGRRVGVRFINIDNFVPADRNKPIIYAKVQFVVYKDN